MIGKRDPQTKFKSYREVWPVDVSVVPPINGEDIPGFREWVCWNGYYVDHEAFDFAAYINNNNMCVLGLPPETNIRSIADGTVVQIYKNSDNDGYRTFIRIGHKNENDSDQTARAKLLSRYTHVRPLVEVGDQVEKGEIIAKLYKDPGNESGRLVHLHFDLFNLRWSIFPTVPPMSVFRGLINLIASPQESLNFRIPGMYPQPRISIANFKEL